MFARTLLTFIAVLMMIVRGLSAWQAKHSDVASPGASSESLGSAIAYGSLACIGVLGKRYGIGPPIALSVFSVATAGIGLYAKHRATRAARN